MTSSARRRPSSADAARRTAYDVVLAVEVDGAYANLLLPRLLRERSLDSRDAAFATELCYGTLRWQGALDQVVAVVSSRPVAKLDPPVRAVLRLGAYQLMRMRVPSHAAVHATVALAREVAGHRVVGFVNGVLRSVAKRSWDEWVDVIAPADDVDRLALRTGHPRWVVEAIAAALGDDRDEIEAALGEDRPVTHLVARPGRISRDELLAAAGPDAAPGPWSPYAVRLGSGDPAQLASVRDGRAAVQDEGSQLMALALANAPLAGSDERWLDVCAGPGGKAALLSALKPDSARLVAAELQPHRARLVQAAVGGASTLVVTADGTVPAWPAASFDRILVDAPCTGLGALRRRPEVRWRRSPHDVERLVPLQVALLRAAVESTRPGGVIAYVTCSPHPAETRGVVNQVLSTCEVELIDARPALPPMPHLGDGPDVQLWQHRHGTDAMYLALLRRGVPAGRDEP